MGAERNPLYYDPDAASRKFAYREEEQSHRKELISAMAAMYHEGLINPEIATMSGEQEDQALADGKWAFYAGYNSLSGGRAESKAGLYLCKPALPGSVGMGAGTLGF